MNREKYIELMDLVFSAYSDKEIREYTESVMATGIKEHGYPRLVANLGILIAHKKRLEYKDAFREMMDFCCKDIPIARTRENGWHVGNDFSVKEIVFCLLEVEKAGVFDREVTDQWRKDLSGLNMKKTYSVIAPVPPQPVNNWAAFGAASEQLRKFAGVGDESDFIENQIKSQIFSFDEKGMYRDPGEPMLYDFVTRLELAIALYFGYEGESKKVLEEEFLKSADITLDMQSVTGEIPFGGRSNLFLHNEATYAALCEFYADFFKKRGDIKKAGQFKSAVRIAIDSILPWLEQEPIVHVKNRYPRESGFGCEDYAYFEKYMITTASCFFTAYLMADDEIAEVDCPAISKNCICETSRYFHKVFGRYGDYFVEFDTKADPHYDASGLGRVHKRGVPSTLCLSAPFTDTCGYEINQENPSAFSICAGIKVGDDFSYACAPEAVYRLVEKEIAEDFCRVKFACDLGNGETVLETCVLSDAGVEISASGNGEVRVLFPVFLFDGVGSTEYSISEKTVVVSYQGNQCVYATDEGIVDLGQTYANRNGVYQGMAVTGMNEVALRITMD